MAKVIIEESQASSVNSYYSVIKALVIGVSVGLAFWLLTLFIQHVILGRLVCDTTIDSYICTNAQSVAGDIATVLALVVGTGVMVKLKVARPLVISISTAISLWGLAVWTSGLHVFEVALWSAILYGLCYSLFLWIIRFKKTVPILIAIFIIVVILRITAGI